MTKKMIKSIFKSGSRGKYENDWLKTNYSFSFAEYFDLERMNFGALRVLNDDLIQAGKGFGLHPHDNMEIITIPLFGKLAHMDSMDHLQEIGLHEVQVMSAGTGIFHSEFNASQIEELCLLQIWIYPKKRNIHPSYEQRAFDQKNAQGKWQHLVSGDFSNKDVLHIHQDARISRIYLKKGENSDYQFNESSFGSFVFLVDGQVVIEGEMLGKRDAIGITETTHFSVDALSDSFVISIEVPGK
jgi:quercetin 2,3-dioxygenase